MSLSRLTILLFALSPFAFGASKEIMELQRDVAMLQVAVARLLKRPQHRTVRRSPLPKKTAPHL